MRAPFIYQNFHSKPNKKRVQPPSKVSRTRYLCYFTYRLFSSDKLLLLLFLKACALSVQLLLRLFV